MNIKKTPRPIRLAQRRSSYNRLVRKQSFVAGVGGDGAIRRRFGGSTPRDEAASGPALVKPKLQLDQIIDRQAEEEKLKSILRCKIYFLTSHRLIQSISAFNGFSENKCRR